MRDIIQHLNKGLCELNDVLWEFDALPYPPVQFATQILKWRQIWTVRWPIKNWEPESRKKKPINMGPCVVLLQGKVMLMDKEKDVLSQDPITICYRCKICMENEKRCFHAIDIPAHIIANPPPNRSLKLRKDQNFAKNDVGKHVDVHLTCKA